MSSKQERIEDYIKRGKPFLKKGTEMDMEKEWEKMVNIRVNDLYGGSEVGNALDIIESYKEKKDPKEIKSIFAKEGHSGMSASLVFQIINYYIVDGAEIVEIIKVA